MAENAFRVSQYDMAFAISRAGAVRRRVISDYIPLMALAWVRSVWKSLIQVVLGACYLSAEYADRVSITDGGSSTDAVIPLPTCSVVVTPCGCGPLLGLSPTQVCTSRGSAMRGYANATSSS